MSTWLARVLSGKPGFEAELVERYTRRLLGLARKQLPDRVRARVDAEDVVQSVYRSFFQRLGDGEFAFQDSHDVWQLLAAITFRKARNAVRYHTQERRDVRRDLPLAPPADASAAPGDVPDPGPRDLDVLFESLEELLAGLPETHRTIVVARLEGYGIEEIAQRVQRTRHTVTRVLAHVRAAAALQAEGLA